MNHTPMNYNRIIMALLIILNISCKSDKNEVQKIFDLLNESQTGIDFSNNLTFSNDFNVYKYRNFYNYGISFLGFKP